MLKIHGRHETLIILCRMQGKSPDTNKPRTQVDKRSFEFDTHASKFFNRKETFRCMKEAVRVPYIQVYTIVSCPDKNLDIVHH